MVTYIAFDGPICVGLVYGEAHAASLLAHGYRIEPDTNQEAVDAMEAREALRVHAGIIVR